MDGTALRTVRTRRRAVALAAVTAFALTATACSGGQSASTTTTKSRADMQREAAEKDGTLDLSLVNEGSDVSAAEAVDSMRVAAVGKTRTDAAATAPSAGGGSSSSGSSIGDVTPQAPRPTSSGSVTPEAQTPVVPWSGIETRVLVTSIGSEATFKASVCNTTTRQRTIVQNKAAAAVVIRSNDGARLDSEQPGPGSATLTIGPSECREIQLARAGWNRKTEPLTSPPNQFTVQVLWDATELGTVFSKDFESGPVVVLP